VKKSATKCTMSSTTNEYLECWECPHTLICYSKRQWLYNLCIVCGTLHGSIIGVRCGKYRVTTGMQRRFFKTFEHCCEDGINWGRVRLTSEVYMVACSRCKRAARRLLSRFNELERKEQKTKGATITHDPGT
jgi:ribosomal protein S27E